MEFGEFCQLAAKFLVEEDEEALKKELKEAFRIYDKEGVESLHQDSLTRCQSVTITFLSNTEKSKDGKS